MKQGQTLVEFAQQIEREQRNQMDFVADTDRITMHAGTAGRPFLELENHGTLDLTQHAQNQLFSHLKIPKKFSDLMTNETATQREREALVECANARMQGHPSKRLVRAYEDSRQCRAILSNRYRRLDNFDLVTNVLPVLHRAPDLQIASCQVTDRKLFLKATFPRIQGEIVPGDVVRSGVCISNSEVGVGRLVIEQFVERLICKNGMVAGSNMKRNHVGRNVETTEDVERLFRDETMALDDQAFWMKVQDVVASTLDSAHFEQTLAKLRESTEQRIADPIGTVERLGNRFSLNEQDQAGILTKLLTGDSLLHSNDLHLTRYGLIQAVTAHSQDVDDYEAATDFETLGGRILDLSPTEWSVIEKAA